MSDLPSAPRCSTSKIVDKLAGVCCIRVASRKKLLLRFPRRSVLQLHRLRKAPISQRKRRCCSTSRRSKSSRRKSLGENLASSASSETSLFASPYSTAPKTATAPRVSSSTTPFVTRASLAHLPLRSERSEKSQNGQRRRTLATLRLAKICLLEKHGRASKMRIMSCRDQKSRGEVAKVSSNEQWTRLSPR